MSAGLDGVVLAIFGPTASGKSAVAEEIAARRPDGELARVRARGRRIDGRLTVELASAGHADASEVVDTLGSHLGVGIANYVNVFNPEVVVVGGGLARAGELLLEPARRVVAERALPAAREFVRVTLAVLGPEAGLIGSGLVGFQAAASPAA